MLGLLDAAEHGDGDPGLEPGQGFVSGGEHVGCYQDVSEVVGAAPAGVGVERGVADRCGAGSEVGQHGGAGTASQPVQCGPWGAGREDRVVDCDQRGGDLRTAALIAVHDAILATSTPRTALNWLRGGAGAAVLADLAAGTTAIRHAALDANPRRRGADYLRHVLVAADVLPARDEPLARLEAWVAITVLSGVEPPEHRRLLHAYATWQVLRP